ncbi:tandem-95 repeat protein, partial [Aquabacterium lacunae]
ARNDVVGGDEDTPFSFDPRANDTDPENNPLTILTVNGQPISVSQPVVIAGKGTVSMKPDGSLEFKPEPNFNGSFDVPYTVSDGQPGSVPQQASITVTIAPKNDLPVPQPDPTDPTNPYDPVTNSYNKATPEDTPVSGKVVGSDVDGDPLTYGLSTNPAQQPKNGTVVVNGDGTWTYTPAPNYNGPDSFTVTISDGKGGVTTTVVNLNVTPVNDAPVANPDSASTPINTVLSNINVKGNDTDVDNPASELTVVNPKVDPAKGTVTLNPDGTLNFTPATDVTGPVTITYTVRDKDGLEATSTVLVVVGANTPPDSANVTKTTLEDTPLTLNKADFAFSDADAGQSLKAVRIDSLPLAGSLSLNGAPVAAGQVVSLADIEAGKLVFTPAANANANGNAYATFGFSVQDSAGSFDTVPNVVTVNVTSVNDDPTPRPPQNDPTNPYDPVTNRYNKATPEDTPVSGKVVGSDVDGDPLTYGLSTNPAQQPKHGTVVVNGDGTWTYTPAPNYNGPDSFTVTIDDGKGGVTTTVVNLNVTPVNDAPVANPDNASTPINTVLSNINVKGNDTDVDNPASELTVVNPQVDPAKGTVTLNPDGTLNFTPATDVTGPVTITYTVRDKDGLEATSTVLVVVGANTPPDSANVTKTTLEDTPLTLSKADFAFNDADAGQTLKAVRIDSLPLAGSLSLNGAPVAAGQVVSLADIEAGKLVFTPAANANGNAYATFGFSVQDSAGSFDTVPNVVTVNVTSVNDDPTPRPPQNDPTNPYDPVTNRYNKATPEDTPVSGKVVGSDVDGDLLTYGLSTNPAQQPKNGTVVVNGDGTWTYTPAPNYNGPDSFTVTISDGKGGVTTTVVNLNVTPVNDAPSVAPLTVNVSEEGLAGGLQDTNGAPDTTNLTKVSGSINISDVDSSTFTVSLTAPTAAVQTATGQNVVWVSDGNGGLIGKAGSASGATVLTATINNAGSYTVELLQPLKHTGAGEDVLDIAFGVSVSDGQTTTRSTLTVRVEDDAPTAPANVVDSVSVLDTNVLITLDVSGSMNDDSGITVNGVALTRLQAAVQSINNLLEKYDALGTVAVRLVTFSSTSQTLGGEQWLTIADAKALLANITATGGTNYDFALSTAQAAFATTAGKISGAQNVSYFFSDGNPTLSSTNPNTNTNSGSTTDVGLGDGIDATEEAAWKAFLSQNGVNSYAIGLGSGVNQSFLNPVAYDGRFALDTNGNVVTDLSQLDAVLSNTVRAVSSGELIANGAVGTPLGADGGRIQSIVIDGQTYTFNASAPEITVTTTLGGVLKLNMATGAYTYTAPDKLSANTTETFTYTLVDNDGDVASSALVLNVDRNAPVPGAPTITSTAISVSEEGLSGGITDTAAATGATDTTNAVTASGQLGFATTGGATVSSVVAVAPTTAVVTASGQTVVWLSDGNGGLIGKAGSADGATVATLTMSRGGAYTFSLSAPLKHAGSGEDVLNLGFGARVLDSSNRVGGGTFTVKVEDDAPSASIAPVTAGVTTINTNLLITLDISGSMDQVPAGQTQTRLEQALQGIRELLDRYDSVGNVAVRLVTFNNTTGTLGDSWLTVDQAKALLNTQTIDATGGTNYDFALSATQAAFNTTAGKLSNAQNVTYFISDGNPTLSSTNPVSTNNGGNNDGANTNTLLGDGIDTTEEANWITFLNNNQMKVFAVGVGSDLTNTTYLNPVAYDGQASSNANGFLVTDVSQLGATLSNTVGQAFSGNIVGNLGLTGMGADGFARIDSVTSTAGARNFDAANPVVTLTTDLGGTLTLNLQTSDYTYVPPAAVTAGQTDSVRLVLSDKDGDTTSTAFNFALEASQVRVGTASAETITGTAAGDRIMAREGNDVVNSGAGNDVVFGNAGNDTIDAGAGNDTVVGGAGSDVMTGGLGSDVFAWNLSDPGTSSANRAVDTIKDFNTAPAASGGDVLDLRDLLQGETSANIENFLDIQTSATQTVIRISPSGSFTGGTYSSTNDTQQIVLEGVNLRDVNAIGLGSGATEKQIIDKLIEQGKLLIGNN